MKRGKGNLTFQDLTNITGYSIRRLRQLIKDGLPHETKKNPHGGKRILIFDQDEVELYLAEHDFITPKQREQADREIAKAFSTPLPDDFRTFDFELPDLSELDAFITAWPDGSQVKGK